MSDNPFEIDIVGSEATDSELNDNNYASQIFNQEYPTNFQTSLLDRTVRYIDKNHNEFRQSISPLLKITDKKLEDTWSKFMNNIFDIDIKNELESVKIKQLIKSSGVNKAIVEDTVKKYGKLKDNQSECIEFSINNKKNVNEIIEQNKALLASFEEDTELLKQYIQLHEKFCQKYRSLYINLTATEEVFVNTLKAIGLLTKNAAISRRYTATSVDSAERSPPSRSQPTDAEYRSQIEKFISDLDLTEIMKRWLLLRSQTEMLKTCLILKEYEFQCVICDLPTNGENTAHVLDPCGHLICGDCAVDVKDKKCPFCRKDFYKAIRLFRN